MSCSVKTRFHFLRKQHINSTPPPAANGSLAWWIPLVFQVATGLGGSLEFREQRQDFLRRSDSARLPAVSEAAQFRAQLQVQ